MKCCLRLEVFQLRKWLALSLSDPVLVGVKIDNKVSVTQAQVSEDLMLDIHFPQGFQRCLTLLALQAKTRHVTNLIPWKVDSLINRKRL